jgi:CRP-like cAMP-binding protein
MPDTNDRSSNLLLRALSADDVMALGELEYVKLAVNQILDSPSEPTSAIYFPMSGIISVVAQNEMGHGIEVAMIGSEGMTGISVLLGVDRSANHMIVQTKGSALRLSVLALQRALLSRPEIARIFRGYVHVLITQISETARANTEGHIPHRLARWLLMWHDRSLGNELNTTHDLLAVLLGSTRATVTLALQNLKRCGLIRTMGSRIEVLDRAGLMAVAEDFYGVPEAAYERIQLTTM